MSKITFKGIITLVLSGFLFISCSKSEIENETLTEDLSPAEVSAKAVPIPGQYIVVLNTSQAGDLGKNLSDYSASKKAVADFASGLFSEKRMAAPEFLNVYSKSISGVTVKLSETQVQELSRDKRVAYIEQDRIFQFAPPCGTPNGGPCDPDDGGDGGDGGGNTSQETPYGISRVNGGVTYTGSNVAWIIDSGVDAAHEDLNVNTSAGYNAFTSGPDAKSLDDLNGHGSHVAGTIAAIDNSVGVIGVAAGAAVVPVKVLDRRGSGSYSGVIAGVDHVGANGSAGDVANMSLGGPVSQALDDAVIAASNKGVWFSIAAGNSSADANNYSPARANGNYIVTISAMDINDNWASFSNFANPPIDYCAPGVSIKSTWKSGGYNTISGTSMAAPHAAGVLLLGNGSTNGTVNNDPDGNPDPIIVH